jgi:hypothetical protein
MATVTHAVSTVSSSNSSSYTSSAFTPVDGDLLVVFVVASDTTTDAATLSSSVGEQTFSRIVTTNKNTNADRLYAFVSNFKATAISQTVTFDCTGDQATGAIIGIARISGIPLIGLGAIKQYAVQTNQGGATTPNTVFSNNVLSGNPTLGFIGNGTNTATMTPPTNWSELSDVGYNSPSTGLEYVYRNSGFNGTNIIWGNNSSSPFGSIILEIAAQAVDITWLEVEKFIGSNSDKTIATVFGSASGTHQHLSISWLELAPGAASNGTSNKIIASISGSSSGALLKYVRVTWLEIEYYTTSNGTSNKIIGSITGNSAGTHQNLYISWTELELTSAFNAANSNKIIASILGSATGTSPRLTSHGTSNKTIGGITGTAIGSSVKLVISWLKVESTAGNIGSSSITINITGNAVGIHPVIHGTSNKTFNISYVSHGEATYSVITWLKIEQEPTTVGYSSKVIASISGTSSAITTPLRSGSSNKVIATILVSSIGKIKISGSSNKVIATLFIPAQVWNPSLRRYISPARNHHFIAQPREFHFTSAVRTHRFTSLSRTRSLSPESRTHHYITPNRIGI